MLVWKNLVVMEQAVERGIRGVKSPTGLTGGDAVKVQTYMNSGKGLSGDTILDAVSKAVATNEVNARWGSFVQHQQQGLLEQYQVYYLH